MSNDIESGNMNDMVLRCLVWVAMALRVGFEVEFADEQIDHGGKVSN